MPQMPEHIEQMVLSGENLQQISAENFDKLTTFLQALRIDYEVSVTEVDIPITREDFDLSPHRSIDVTRTWNAITGHGSYLALAGRARRARPLKADRIAFHERLAPWHQDILRDEISLSRNGLMSAADSGYLRQLPRPLGAAGIEIVYEVLDVTNPHNKSE